MIVGMKIKQTMSHNDGYLNDDSFELHYKDE